MSKAVKSVGKAVTGVLKGVKKAASKIWEKAKESKVLKTLAIGAAVYFTGGAALGAMGMGAGAAAGGGLSGAMAGISSAWGGLTGAAGALASGNLAGAGSSLASGWTGAATGGNALAQASINSSGGLLAGGGAPPVITGAAPSIASSTAGTAAADYGGTAFSNWAKEQAISNAGTEVVKDGVKKGLLDSLGEYGKGQLVASGVTTLGNTVSGYAQAKAEEEAEKDYLRRYNRNAWQIG